MFIQFFVNGVCAGSVFGLVALGFGLIYYSTRVFHLAHGAVYTLSAYAMYYLFANLNIGLLPAAAGAFIVAGTGGVLCDSLVYKPLRHHSASAAAVLMSSLGVYVVIAHAIAIVAGNEAKSLRSGPSDVIILGEVYVTYLQIAEIVLSSLVFSVYWFLIMKTRFGQMCRALADNPMLFSVIGLDEAKLRRLIFIVGSVLVGVGAVLGSLDVGIDPYAGMTIVLAAVVACIIGGDRRFLAPWLGAIMLGVLQSFVVWKTSVKWQSAVTFALLLAFLVWRQGLPRFKGGRSL
jgi:branched-chain amino acid transport system permease protein